MIWRQGDCASCMLLTEKKERAKGLRTRCWDNTGEMLLEDMRMLLQMFAFSFKVVNKAKINDIRDLVTKNIGPLTLVLSCITYAV